jgi:ribosome-associated protein
VSSGKRAEERFVANHEVQATDLPTVIVRAAELAQERKAHDVMVLDLRGISSATDFFLLASGRSDVQVKAIADHLMEELREEGQRPDHVEGLQGGRWVLLDYIDFVVHVFHPQARGFYQLENLWGDAPTWTVPDAEEGDTA